MKPYYQHGGITIYHGDCREVLPGLEKVDLVLTDPPYGIGESKGRNVSRGGMYPSKDYGCSDWDESPPNRDVIQLVLDSCQHAIIWGGNYFDLPPSRCWLVWDKDNGNADFADCELAWTNLSKAVRKIRWRWQGMIQEQMGRHKERRWHPTQKPVAVMRWAAGHAPDNNTTVLDPFMGSGTTLRAAKDLGRKAIGVEICEAYCEIAAKDWSKRCLNSMTETTDTRAARTGERT